MHPRRLSLPIITPLAPEEIKGPPFWAACRYGHMGVVAALLSKPNANITQENAIGQTPFWSACRYGHKNVVDALLRDPRIDADLHKADEHIFGALWIACYEGRKDVVALLLADTRITRQFIGTNQQPRETPFYSITSKLSNPEIWQNPDIYCDYCDIALLLLNHTDVDITACPEEDTYSALELWINEYQQEFETDPNAQKTKKIQEVLGTAIFSGKIDPEALSMQIPPETMQAIQDLSAPSDTPSTSLCMCTAAVPHAPTHSKN